MVDYKNIKMFYMNKTINVDFGGQGIAVKAWLPAEQMLDMIQFIVRGAMDPDRGTFNPFVTSVWETIAMVKYFTDIEFSDEELANPGKLYDDIVHSGLYDAICGVIDTDVLTEVSLQISDTVVAVERFNNSFAGIMTAMKGNSDELSAQMDSLIEKVKNKEGIGELIEIQKSLGKVD